MTPFYSPSANAFYHREIHGNDIPADAIDVDAETYEILRAGVRQGLPLVVNGTDVSVGAKPPPTTEQIASMRAAALQSFREAVRVLRSEVIGSNDPVKLIEYVDKAQAASAVIDGTATAAQMAEASAEAARLGLADAAAAGTVWMARAESMREARTNLNLIVADGVSAIEAAADENEILSAKAASMQALGDFSDALSAT